MDHTIETAGLESAGGFLRWRQHHALPPGSACANCGTTLLGSWCYHCGQLGADFHRSTFHLIAEAFESFFHADGRLVRTLPRLIVAPGRLTHDFLAGKRAPQIPPLRLFLVSVLLLFLAGEATHAVRLDGLEKTPEKARLELGDKIAHAKIRFSSSSWQAASDWVQKRVPNAIDHPDALLRAMGGWAERAAVLSLPLSAAILALIFLLRRFTLFDHLIFSMHSLSFQALLVTTTMLLAQAFGSGPLALLLLSPIHLFVHMRDVYGTGVIGTVVRMSVLATLSSLAFLALLLGLVLVGLASLGG